MEENHLLIRVLRYGTSKISFSANEIFEELELSLEEQQKVLYLIASKQLFTHNSNHSAFASCARTLNLNHTHDNSALNVLLYCSTDDHFRLIDYEELKHARDSSLAASNQAKKALWVSIAAMGLSVVFSIVAIVVSLNSDINIPESLYRAIEIHSEEQRQAIQNNTKEIQELKVTQSSQHQETMQILKPVVEKAELGHESNSGVARNID